MKDNGIEVSADDVELAIENVGVLNPEKKELINDNISEKNSTENILDRRKVDIRKVWKTKYLGNEIYFVDSNTGEYIKCDPITDE